MTVQKKKICCYLFHCNFNSGLHSDIQNSSVHYSVIQHGCNIVLTNQDLFILALIKANFLLPQMPRKYSAPGQLCSMGGHMPASVNPTAGRKGSLCVPNQQFGYTCPTYSMPQWAQTSPLSSTAPPAGLQQGFLVPSGAHQSGNSCGSTNLRTTQAS